ncbi:MAG: glycosyltransferase family 4 protein [Oceanospirillales bacterium]|nr:glycosyltransferase family 4 protein [Oceanospirillales bacterium]
MRKIVNVTVGTDIKGQGGIATVLRGYRDSGFFERHNVRLVATHNSNVLFGQFGSVILFLTALAKIFIYGLFFKVGLVHIHMASRGSFSRKLIVARLAKFFGCKVVLHLHGGEFREFYVNECDARKKKRVRELFESVDKVIVLSSQWIEWAKETFSKSDHIDVIYNTLKRSDGHQRYTKVGSILFLGRLCKGKGTFDLINAFQKVNESCPEAHLYLGGDGDLDLYKKQVKNLGLEHSVSFPGWVDGERKAELLSIADVYCLPSYNEGFPMGVLEAMASGVAIVSSYAGGIPDAVSHNEEGLLIEAGDQDGLADALIKLIKDRGLNSQLVGAATNKFERCFSEEAIMPKLDKIYAELLSGDVQHG